MRSALFWDVTRRRFAVLYRRFETIYRSHLQGSRSLRRKSFFLESLNLEYGADRLSRNVGNYRSALRNIPEVRRSMLQFLDDKETQCLRQFFLFSPSVLDSCNTALRCVIGLYSTKQSVSHTIQRRMV